MRVRLVLLALLVPAGGAALGQATPAAGAVPKLAQTATVTTAEPLPLGSEDGLDRAVESFDLTDGATAPLTGSVVDVLRLDPSVTLSERGPGGVQADLSIRGTTFEQTLVLVDGLRLNDPETGHLNLDLSLPLEALSGVEVLHGSGSTFFGSDAIGGAINLMTAAPEHGSASVRLGGGNMGQTEQHLQLSGVRGALAARLTGSRETSDGFSYAGENDRGFHAGQLALDSFVALRRGLAPTEVLLGASDRPYGANLFYGSYDSAERTKGWLGAVRQPLPAGWLADFAFRRHTDLFVLEVSNPNLYRNNHVTSLWQADVRRRSAVTAKLDAAYGLEADGDAIRSSNLGRHARNQGAGYASLSLHGLRRVTVQAGGRQEIFAGPTAVFSPSGSAGFFAGHGVRVHAAAGRGFRLPTYVDLYYSDPTTVGNPGLKPETSASYEGGAEWTPSLVTVRGEPRLRLSATGFTLRQANAVDYSKMSAAAKYQATNVGQLAYSGVETRLTWRPAPGQRIDLGETYVHAGPPPAGLISEYAYNYASHNGSVAWQATSSRLQVAGRTQVSVVQQTGRTVYGLWNVSLTRNQGLVRPYVRVEDLANVRYSELPGVPLPGRSVMAGVTLQWSGR